MILQMQCPLPFASYTLLSNTAATKSCSLPPTPKTQKRKKKKKLQHEILPIIDFPGPKSCSCGRPGKHHKFKERKQFHLMFALFLDNTWYYQRQSTPNQFVWPFDRTSIEAASITAPCTPKLLFLWGVRRYTSGIPCSCCNWRNHIYRKQPMS